MNINRIPSRTNIFISSSIQSRSLTHKYMNRLNAKCMIVIQTVNVSVSLALLLTSYLLLADFIYKMSKF